jgi:hypothetical protein
MIEQASVQDGNTEDGQNSPNGHHQRAFFVEDLRHLGKK